MNRRRFLGLIPLAAAATVLPKPTDEAVFDGLWSVAPDGHTIERWAFDQAGRMRITAIANPGKGTMYNSGPTFALQYNKDGETWHTVPKWQGG